MDSRRPEPQNLTLADGRYRLAEVLGQGGMAKVYRAYDTRLDAWRAIKVLSPNLSASTVLRHRFINEAKTMARLHHPHIVTVHDIVVDGSRVFIVMELMEGGTLVDLLRRRGCLSTGETLWVGRAVARALGAAHNLGVVHRDIKPENVLLTGEGVAKLGDFGIARVETDDISHTRAGSVLGTWAYMAPEQREGAGNATPASDVYGLAALLWFLVKARQPFDLYSTELHDRLFDGVDDRLAGLIKKGTRYDGKDRWAHAGEMADAIDELAERIPYKRIGMNALEEAHTVETEPGEELPREVPRELAPESAPSISDLSIRPNRDEPPPVPIPAPVPLEAVAARDSGAAAWEELAQEPAEPPSAGWARASTTQPLHDLPKLSPEGIDVSGSGLTESEHPPPGGGRRLLPFALAAMVLVGLTLGVLGAWYMKGRTQPAPSPTPTPTQVIVHTPPEEPAVVEPEQEPQEEPEEILDSEVPDEDLLDRVTQPQPKVAKVPSAPKEEVEPQEQAQEEFEGGGLFGLRKRPEGVPEGTFTIESWPPSRVTVAGDDVGSTPWTGALPEGSHRLVLRTSDARRYATRIQVDADDSSAFCWNFDQKAACER